MRLLGLLLSIAGAIVAQPQRSSDTITMKAGPVKITPIHHASLMLEASGNVIHHPDHLDPKAIAQVRQRSTVIVAPEAVAKTVTGVRLRNWY